MSVHKLHRQHTSVVMTIPKWVLKKLDAGAGDYVTLNECSESPVYEVVCLQKLENIDARDSRNSGRKDRGG